MIDFSTMKNNSRLNAEQVKDFFDNNPNASVQLTSVTHPNVYGSDQIDYEKVRWSFNIDEAGYFYVNTKANNIETKTGGTFNPTVNLMESILNTWSLPVEEYIKEKIQPGADFITKLRELINKVATGAGEGDIFDKVNATNLTLGISNINLSEFNGNHFIQNIYFKKASSNSIENSDDDSMEVPF